MKRCLKVLICTLMISMFCIVGCSVETGTTKSYTYNVETGDKIKLTFDTSGDYTISADMPFVIEHDDEVLSQGTFIKAEYYDWYVDAAKTDENCKIIDSGKRDNCSYIMWSYNDSEYDYVIMIDGSNTSLLLGNDVSEESAKECFDRLEVSVEE